MFVVLCRQNVQKIAIERRFKSEYLHPGEFKLKLSVVATFFL